jgi:WD40 repeat protein
VKRPLIYLALAGLTGLLVHFSHRLAREREAAAAQAARENPRGRVPGFRRLTGITALAALPGGRLAIGDATGRVFVQSLTALDAAPATWWAAHDAAIRRTWSLGEDGLATASADGSVGRWGLDGAPRGRLRLPEAHLNDAVPHAGESTVYVAADRGSVARLCDPEPCWQHLGVHGAAAYAVAFSPDGAHLATGGMDGHVALRDPLTGERSAQWRVSPGWVTALAWTPAGLFVGDNGGRVVFVPGGNPEAATSTAAVSTAPVTQLLAHGALGDHLVAGAEDGTVAMLQVAGPTVSVAMKLRAGAPVRALAFASGTLFAGCADGLVRRFTTSASGGLTEGTPLEVRVFDEVSAP